MNVTLNIATDSTNFLELTIERQVQVALMHRIIWFEKGPLLGGVFHPDLGFLTRSPFITVVYFSPSRNLAAVIDYFNGGGLSCRVV